MEAEEAYDIASLKKNESGLARCYMQLYEAARRVSAFDWSGSDSAARAAIEDLRKVVSPLAHAPPRQSGLGLHPLQYARADDCS
jgi:hypothetical protein